METEASRVPQFFYSLVLWESGRTGAHGSKLSKGPWYDIFTVSFISGMFGEGGCAVSQRILVTNKRSLLLVGIF